MKAYDAVEDIAPASVVATLALVLLGPPGDLRATLGAMVAEARAKPGDLNLGTVGIGTTQHLVAEVFQSASPAGDIRSAHCRPAVTEIVPLHAARVKNDPIDSGWLAETRLSQGPSCS